MGFTSSGLGANLSLDEPEFTVNRIEAALIKRVRELELDGDKLADLLVVTLNDVAAHDPDRASEFVALLASRRLALDVDESDDVVTIYATPAGQATWRLPILEAPRSALVVNQSG